MNNDEVKKTLERIRKWEWKYTQDWNIFENSWKWWWEKLQNKPEWYYTEWTIDTPWLNYRWAKRIVLWKGWEKYYTEDHYHTFIKIN